MTENEINISNLSYVNKDFNTIFPELLDLVGTLTNRWDPSTSNESDPGVVLMKLMAIIADKNSYNIDKNVLESFPLSVTQTGNARKLYDILGYSMNWYRSASTTVQMYWNNASDFGENAQVTLPKYTTMLTTDEGDIVYTLVENVTFTYDARRVTNIHVVQGVCQDYEINGTNIVTLDNLDENRRVYFNETQVAQNGIFVYNYDDGVNSSEDWTRVDNLEIQESKSKVFKFGVLPNSDTCYIEFPLDIASIIGSGICIKYLVSAGVDGNIKAGALTTFYSDNDIDVANVTANSEDQATTISPSEAISVKNDSSATSGANPESLDEAYNNFKRTVGTFETLVSCRDYDNYIYNIEDDTNGFLVSNAITSDRTNDLNFTTYIVTLLNNGIVSRRLYKQAADANNASMTPYDICLRLLEFVLNISNEQAYNKTFSVNQQYEDVESAVDESKCINHEYFDISNIQGKPFIFKNFYKLIGSIVTYYKVSETEAKEIEDNIKLALMRAYNARGVNFGEPIIYDELIQTIQNSDTRIKTVVLNEPEYELRWMDVNDTVGDYASSHELTDELKDEYLAKLVASGNVQLFDFDLNFRYDFGQEAYDFGTTTGSNPPKNGVITQIRSISSGVTDEYKEIIENAAKPANNSSSFAPEDTGYIIRRNENIMLSSPNLYSQKTYSAYVNYRWMSKNGPESTIYTGNTSKASSISAEVITELSASTQLFYGASDFTITTEYWLSTAPEVKLKAVESGTWYQAQNGTIVLNITDPYIGVGCVNSVREIKSTTDGDGKRAFNYTINITILGEFSGVDVTIPLVSNISTLDVDTTSVTANTEYQIQEGESLYMNYTDSDNVSRTDYYGPGTIIKPSMDMIDIRYAERIISKTYTTYEGNTVTNGFITMSSGDTLEIRAINEQLFNVDTLYCLWFTNDSVNSGEETTYTLFDLPNSEEQDSGVQERILQNNEYFLYTNQTQDVLYILGSGTKLSRQVKPTSGVIAQTRTNSSLSLININNNGLSEIPETSWYTYQKAREGNLVQTEMQIITLGEDARFGIITDDNNTKHYYYKSTAEDNWTLASSISGVKDYFGRELDWSWDVVVNIDSTTSEPQEILDGQFIDIVNDEAGTSYRITSDSDSGYTYITFNSDLSLTGGSNIAADVTTLDGEVEYALSAYAFNASAANGISLPLRGLGEYIPVNYDANINTNTSYNFKFEPNSWYIIPIVPVLKNTTLTLDSNCSIFSYANYISNTSTGGVTFDSTTSNLTYVAVRITNSENKTPINIFSEWTATAESDTSNDLISLGNIYKIVSDSSTNPLGVSQQILASSANVNTFLGTYMSNSMLSSYDITYIVDDTDAIDTDLYDSNGDVFNSNAIWDSNNLISRFTIPQMKTDKGSGSYYIRVASSSKS